MAHCKTCGEQITWAKDVSGRPHRPLTYIGMVKVIINNIVQDAPAFENHVCDDEKVKVWNEVRNEQLQYQVERQEELDLQWRLALRYKCPKCGVPRRVRCENLIEREKGKKKEIVWPHPDRLKLNPKWVPQNER